MVDNKYIKVVYQSKPIGKEGIVLELTTFDVEKYEKDQKLQKIKKYALIEKPKETGNFIYDSEKQNYIKDFLNNKIVEENKNLMEIIERQQEQIDQLNNYIVKQIRVKKYEV